jgi:threonine/homoserine/homoserine lactone efflux protein
MDPTAALLTGLTVGLVIAMQVGAVSLLLVEAAVVSGARAGVAAGIGVATADLAFAAIAVAAGGAAGAKLASHEHEIRLIAAFALAAVAIAGLVGLIRSGAPAHGRTPQDPARDASAAAHYARFLAITAANPLTIASFAAVAAALSLDGGASAIAFVAGVALASTAWHVALTLAAGHAGRWLTPSVRRGLAIGGRIGVLAIAAGLALGAGDDLDVHPGPGTGR